MSLAIAPPDHAALLAPLLPALPAAAASTQPAVKILPLLSPILRQRVRLLSESSTEPWLRLLCYDASKAVELADVVRGPALEPHPVSGEVEIDWANDAQARYRRLDSETLQALVALPELGIGFQLVYCVGDHEGGGDGWRIGEATVVDKPSPFSRFGGASTIFEAERQFQEGQRNGDGKGQSAKPVDLRDDDDDNDDDYWGRYDATPARTPAVKRSPGPGMMSSRTANPHRPASSEDDYFAQYDQVQPAMDNHDPDEEAQQSSPLRPRAPDTTVTDQHVAIDIYHPRPESSASSSGSSAVARLEETAGKQEQNEFGVKQHVSRTVRSLYMLARASGITRDEFARLVTTELAVLGITDEDD